MSNKEQTEAFSKYCRENVGLDATEVADLAKVPRRTFYDWWTTRRRAVELIVNGIKREQEHHE